MIYRTEMTPGKAARWSHGIRLVAVDRVTCPRCRLIIPVDNVALPNRCVDPACPLKEPKP